MALPEMNDPVYEAVLRGKLEPYLAAAREWWDHLEEHSFPMEGCFELEDGPPGWHVKVCHPYKRSPVLNIPVFPYVPTAALQLLHVAGGMRKMVARVIGNGLTIGDITVIVKQNLTSTAQASQFLAFVDAKVYRERPTGQYIYFNHAELQELSTGLLSDRIRVKAMRILIGQKNVT